MVNTLVSLTVADCCACPVLPARPSDSRGDCCLQVTGGSGAEDFRVANMVGRPKPCPTLLPTGGCQGGLNKGILGAGWSASAQTMQMIRYKAASAGVDVVFVPVATS